MRAGVLTCLSATNGAAIVGPFAGQPSPGNTIQIGCGQKNCVNPVSAALPHDYIPLPTPIIQGPIICTRLQLRVTPTATMFETLYSFWNETAFLTKTGDIGAENQQDQSGCVQHRKGWRRRFNSIPRHHHSVVALARRELRPTAASSPCGLFVIRCMQTQS
jgi:hypothetical protein